MESSGTAVKAITSEKKSQNETETAQTSERGAAPQRPLRPEPLAEQMSDVLPSRRGWLERQLELGAHM